jgi:uncharacterized repeat protein (TIGR04042 family)
MPEMRFLVRWPDGEEVLCYSPSLVVRDYLVVGGSYAVPDFVLRSRTMLGIASERVKSKFGFHCSAAMDQLAQIEARAALLDPADPSASVTILRFDLPEGE